MPTTNMQSVPVHTFPEMGSEVKQDGNLIDLPNTQDNHGQYDSYQKERLFVGSSVKSDVKDCQTPTERDNQDNIITPFASVPNYNLLGFGQPPSQYESNALNDVQPVNQLASTSRGRSTLMETPKVLGFKTFKTSKSESSYEAIKPSAAGSSKIFAEQAPKHAYDRVLFKPQVSADTLVGDPKWAQSNSILSQFSKRHQRTESFSKFPVAGSTYGPILMGAPLHSKTNQRKPSQGGLKYPEANPLVVSSGAIVILQGGEHTQGLGNTLPNSVKPLRFPSNVDFNQYETPQSSQTSSVALNVGGRHGKLWPASLYNSMRREQNSAGPKPPKPSESDCRDDVGQYSVASSSKFNLRGLESDDDGGKSVSHYESREDVKHPRKFQKTYNTRHSVVKSSIASSGEIRMMSSPVSVQSKMHSIKLQVTAKPNASSPEHSATFPSTRTAQQYQPFAAYPNSRNIQPTTGTYASPPPSGYKVFSSFMGTSYKQGKAPPKPLSKSRFSATKPYVADSDEINAIRVRPYKWPKSIFGNRQNQWASGNNVGALTANSGALQSVLPSSDLGHRQVENAHDIITIPDMFGKGVIRRLSTISSSYRPGLMQNLTQLTLIASVSFNKNGCRSFSHSIPKPSSGSGFLYSCM